MTSKAREDEPGSRSEGRASGPRTTERDPYTPTPSEHDTRPRQVEHNHD